MLLSNFIIAIFLSRVTAQRSCPTITEYINQTPCFPTSSPTPTTPCAVPDCILAEVVTVPCSCVDDLPLKTSTVATPCCRTSCETTTEVVFIPCPTIVPGQ
ncbi:hypothetical protein BX600DRAFT_476121 [Xylariales sp. PMI_506]|nr:hypothetical protein BX600DRAFT_476121 [Xylariales sp. PMI_506]